jgi:vacuolar-type H+-ATPase subunit H
VHGREPRRDWRACAAHAREVVAIDVLQLINRLETLVNSGTRVPLTSRAIVDEQEFLDIIDQLRVAVPEELRQAKRVSQDRDRVISQAQSEADRLIESAREQAMLLLQEDQKVRDALEYAARITADATQEAEEIKRGADAYATEILDGLENELMKLLATVRRGKATLQRSVGELPANGLADAAERMDAARTY